MNEITCLIRIPQYIKLSRLYRSKHAELKAKQYNT